MGLPIQVSLPAGYSGGSQIGAAPLIDNNIMLLVKGKSITLHGSIMTNIAAGMDIIQL